MWPIYYSATLTVGGCIWRWRTEPLRAAADWHAAIEDAPLENNKSGLLNLARLSGADARRPWWMVSGESVWLRQRNLTGPSCEEPTPSRRCFIKPPFMFQRARGKFWMEERRPGYSQSNTHHRSIFDWWQTKRTAPSSLTFPKQRLGFSPVVTSVNFISEGDLEGLGLKSNRSFGFSPYNDFHRVQDLNGGEIMSASHYCKLYPRLRPSLNS